MASSRIYRREALGAFRADFDSLNKAINFNEENPRKLALLVNARSKILRQLRYCIAVIMDPKLKLTSEAGRRKDFTNLKEKALLKDNPAVSKKWRDS